MPEPFTLALVGSVVLTEGIKFLYTQAGEVLKRWRERKASAAKEDTKPAEAVLALPSPPPGVLDGTLTSPVIHFDRVEPLAESMLGLWSSLGMYAQGIKDVDASDVNLAAKADVLRRQLETVFSQRITFKGEPRPPSGTPVVVGIADVKTIAGEAAGLVAGTIVSGEIRGELRADKVEAGGKAYGLKVDRIGE
jgi:hypothetical protein